MQSTFWEDEAGFIVSAELVLISTVLVLGLIVGLSEIQTAVVSELNDVSEAIGSLNQSYSYTGFTKLKNFNRGRGFGVAAATAGSIFIDHRDSCDGNECSLACSPPRAESPKSRGGDCAGNRGGPGRGMRDGRFGPRGPGHDHYRGSHGDHRKEGDRDHKRGDGHRKDSDKRGPRPTKKHDA